MTDPTALSTPTTAVEVFLAAEQCTTCGTAHERVQHSRFVDDESITTRWSCPVCSTQNVETLPIHEAEIP